MRANVSAVDRVGGCSIEDWHFSGKPSDVIGWCVSHFSLVKVCCVCGDEYHAKRKHSKTCSDKCRKALSRKQKKEKRYVTINTKAGVIKQEVFW
jgi:predicted nucleic acid-binding Zn ribbon protein